MTDSAAPRRPVRMCARCERVTEDPVLVHQVHAATGPGFNVYACRACAAHYPPQPDPLELIDTASRPSRMTIRVYRIAVDGTRIQDHGEVRTWTGSRFDPTPQTAAFPPCACPSCGALRHPR